MASGKTHATVTMAAAAALTLAAPFYVPHVGAAALAAIPGCLVGVVLTPDLDVDTHTVSDRVVRRSFARLGWLAGLLAARLWRLFWLPYAKAIPHRHWLSHAPVVGTLGRLLYLFLFGGCGIVAAAYHPALDPVALKVFLWAFAGLALSDLLHWIFDLF